MPVLRNKEVAVGTDEEAQASLGRPKNYEDKAVQKIWSLASK